MTRPNTLTWIILLLLTFTSFMLAEQSRSKPVTLIVALAGIKFAIVAWRFMELKKAALIWSAAVLGLLGIILGMTLLLS